jgi:hypothetical protein
MTPSLQEKGSTLDAQMARRPKPFGHQLFPANGWSINGAQRAQPVATGGKWHALENRSNMPIGNRWQPLATVSEHGKEGVNGSSPLEGSAKAPHVGAFAFRSTCSS